MLEVVTPDLYPHYRDELHDMYRLRARVFRDRLGWEVRVCNGEERDEFDELGPLYVLALDEERRVVGSSRLLPTTGPYMLRDVFGQLMEGRPDFQNPLVFEWSKFAIDNRAMATGGLNSIKRTTHEFFCGIAEYCLLRGLREVVTVYDTRIARMLPRIGCQPDWQSQPRVIGDCAAYAAQFRVTPGMLLAMRVAGGLRGAVVGYLPEAPANKAA